MSLKVIGAGFGRTGTLSLKTALEKLGFVKTHHMLEVVPNEAQRAFWHDIALGKPTDWATVFEGYQASVDFPSSTYYKELLTAFPDAKVVLTVRDPDRWYVSARDTIYAIGKALPAWITRLVPFLRRNQEMVDGTIWQRVFDCRFEDEAYAKKVFTDYIEQVKRDVPAEKLLVFEVKEGWEPLCAFLECDVPDDPFPNVNDSKSFKKMIRRIKLVFTSMMALIGIALAASAYAILT